MLDDVPYLMKKRETSVLLTSCLLCIKCYSLPESAGSGGAAPSFTESGSGGIPGALAVPPSDEEPPHDDGSAPARTFRRHLAPL